jgi:hypothetical protein
LYWYFKNFCLLKSRRPVNIEGQLMDYQWLSNIGWAEGYFISSMKRVLQALKVRKFIELLFDEDPNAHVIVCGDFNAEPQEVPAQLIQGRAENTNNPDLWLNLMYIKLVLHFLNLIKVYVFSL